MVSAPERDITNQVGASYINRTSNMGTGWERRGGILVAMAEPEIFVDAGDLPWVKLQRLLRDALADLAGGDVLELASGDGETYDALAVWCEREGHAFARRVQGNGLVSYLIGKDGRAREGSEPESA